MSTESTLPAVTAILQTHEGEAGALLPILHDVQDTLGYVPASAVPVIAQALNLSRAEVHGVISYYHHFRSEPPGRQVVQICRAEACQSMGAEALWAHACKQVGGAGTSADGSVTLEAAYCLGLCASSPAMAVNEKLHARVSTDKLTRVLNAAREAV